MVLDTLFRSLSIRQDKANRSKGAPVNDNSMLAVQKTLRALKEDS